TEYAEVVILLSTYGLRCQRLYVGAAPRPFPARHAGRQLLKSDEPKRLSEHSAEQAPGPAPRREVSSRFTGSLRWCGCMSEMWTRNSSRRRRSPGYCACRKG